MMAAMTAVLKIYIELLLLKWNKRQKRMAFGNKEHTNSRKSETWFDWVFSYANVLCEVAYAPLRKLNRYSIFKITSKNISIWYPRLQRNSSDALAADYVQTEHF